MKYHLFLNPFQFLIVLKGKYVLLLNPDTLIEEDTLFKSFEYMENNPDTGALGVKTNRW